MTGNGQNIAQQLQLVRDEIALAAEQAGRDPQSIQLIAVSKAQPLEKLIAAYDAGQRIFGESYIQEALQKIESLAEKKIHWHFIGRIQSNKIARIAQNFSWVHSLYKPAHATKLDAHRSAEQHPLNVCIQVNLSGESTKGGVGIETLIPLARQIEELPRLTLRGLMTMPNPNADETEQIGNYNRLYTLLQEMRDRGFSMDTLSMGMSNDYAQAIAAGATMVRVGTAIFGPRN